MSSFTLAYATLLAITPGSTDTPQDAPTSAGRVAIVLEPPVRSWIGTTLRRELGEAQSWVEVDYDPETLLLEQAARWAEEGRVDVVVFVSSVKRNRTRTQLKAQLIDAHRGSTVRRVLITNGRRGRFSRRGVAEGAARLNAPLATVVAEVQSRREPEEPAVEQEELPATEVVRAAPPSSPATNAPAVLSLRTSALFAGRKIIYNDFLYGPIRDFSQSGAALLALEAHFRASRAEAGSSRGLNATFGFATSIAGSSTVAEQDASLNTQWQQLKGDIAYLFRLMRGLELGPQAGFGYLGYSFRGGEDSPVQESPGVRYMTASAGVRLAHDNRFVRIRLDAGVLYPLSVGGTLGDAFPNASGLGVRSELLVLAPISNSILIGVDGRFERFGLDLAPELGADFVAGGAVDQFWSLGGTLAFEI